MEFEYAHMILYDKQEVAPWELQVSYAWEELSERLIPSKIESLVQFQQ